MSKANEPHLFGPGLCCKCPGDDNSDNLQKSSAYFVCVMFVWGESQTRIMKHKHEEM